MHEKRTNRNELKTEVNPKQATERSAMKQGKQNIVSKTEQLQYCGNKIHRSTIRQNKQKHAENGANTEVHQKLNNHRSAQ